MMDVAGTSSTLLTPVISAAISGLGSSAGQGLANRIDPCHRGSVARAGLFGAFGSFLFPTPTQNMNTLNQASYFGPTAANLGATYGSYAASSVVGAGSDLLEGD